MILWQALAYRLGSFLLAVVIATAILEQLRDSQIDSSMISIITAGVLQFTHFIYYIGFHKVWRHFTDE